MGRVLTVNLSERVFSQDPLSREYADLFFGGRGLGIALVTEYFLALEREGKYGNAFEEVDPLSADNILVFTTSPTTGTGMLTSGRLHVNFKSPLTDGIGSSNSGGHWAVAFKKTGHDVLCIHGQSETPVYLTVTSQGIEFRDARSLLNLNVEAITNHLLKEAPRDARVMTIGEAGRKLSRMAAIMNDRGRAMGRGGGGAVFGSKNLLAVVACPDNSLSLSVSQPMSLRQSHEEGPGFKAKMTLDV